MTPPREPTPRQLEIHAAMLAFQRDNDGMPPTIRELGELLGITSTNGVSDHLTALERYGLVRHHRKGSPRAWVAIPVQPQPQEGTAP